MTTVSTPATPRPYSTWRTIWLVARREIMVRLRSVAFLVSTGIMLVLLLGSVLISAVTASTAEPPRVAVVAGVELPADTGLRVTDAADQAAAEALLRSDKVDAMVVPDDGPLGYAVIGLTSAPIDVVQYLSVMPPTTALEPSPGGGFLGYLVAIGFGLLFFISAMTFGQTIAQSVVEEKQTRVIEILLASIPTRALFAGKILGTTVLAVGQIVLLMGIAAIGLGITGQNVVLDGLGAPFAWFAVFFLLGFILLAALFAATGAMVSRQEDIGSTTTPVTMLVMIPYFVVVFFNDNPLVVAIMSYVPFSAPVGMPLRVFQQSAQWWEPLLSLGILAATCVAVIAVGARMYENSLLRIGQRVKLVEALKG